MKPFLILGNWTSFALSVNALPQWLAVATLAMLVLEGVRWAESE